MSTYNELLAHPEQAVTFGPKGFQLNNTAWNAICEEAYNRASFHAKPATRMFEQMYDLIEYSLEQGLIGAVKSFLKH